MAAPGATTRRRSAWLGTLESAGDFCHNLLAVTKHLLLSTCLSVSLGLLGLGGAGCHKAPDVSHLQAEALAIIKVHTAELELLQRRLDDLLVRARLVGSDALGIGDAGKTISETRAMLDQLRGLTRTAPAVHEAAIKTGIEEELDKVHDQLVEKLETTTALIRADLAAVENWLANAERRRRVVVVGGSTAPVVPAAAPPTAGASAPSTAAPSAAAPR